MLGLALVGGFAIGAVVALLIELLVPGRIKDEVDLLGVYPLPVLARLPSVRHYPVRSDPSFSSSRLCAPQFRSLRTQLELRSETVARRDDSERAARGKVVVVTSPSRGGREDDRSDGTRPGDRVGRAARRPVRSRPARAGGSTSAWESSPRRASPNCPTTR